MSVDVPPRTSRANHRDVRSADSVLSSDDPGRTLVRSDGAHVGFTEFRMWILCSGRAMSSVTFSRFLVVLGSRAEMQVTRAHASRRIAGVQHTEIAYGSDVALVHHAMHELVLPIEPALPVAMCVYRTSPEPTTVGLLDLAQDALEMREVWVVTRRSQRVSRRTPSFVVSAAPAARYVRAVAAADRAGFRRHMRHTRTHQDSTNSTHEIRVEPCRTRIATRCTGARTAGTGPSFPR